MSCTFDKNSEKIYSCNAFFHVLHYYVLLNNKIEKRGSIKVFRYNAYIRSI